MESVWVFYIRGFGLRDGQNHSRFLLDVGGLVDLNAAAPDMLVRVVERLNWGRRRWRITSRGVERGAVAAGVLEILGTNDLPPAWLSPPSGVNYAVGVEENDRRIGVVHLGQGVGDGRVISNIHH